MQGEQKVRNKKLATVVAAVMLGVLTACGGGSGEPKVASSDAPSAKASVKPGGPGQYGAEYAGAVIKVDVPTPVTDSRVAPLEKFRMAVGAPPVTYYAAEVDNVAGSGEIKLQAITVVTDSGQQVKGTWSSEAVDNWRDRVDINEDTDLYNEAIDLSNGATFDLKEGAKGTYVLITPELKGTPARVYLTPVFGEDVEAVKVTP